MKTKVIVVKTGREVQEHDWVNRKDIKGFYRKYEILEIYEDDETARIRTTTSEDTYLYTTQPFSKLGLKRVLL